MSVLALTKLTTELGRRPDLCDRLLADPVGTLSAYPLTEQERSAVLALDAHALIDLGVHALVVRNLLVRLGVDNGELFTHSTPLLPSN